MREIKLEYLLKADPPTDMCDEGGYRTLVWSLDDIEDGIVVNFIEFGYEVIRKRMFTGLKDNSDKEIYEGDIFKSTALMTPDGMSSAHNVHFHVPVTCVVNYYKYMFCGKYVVNKYKYGSYEMTDRSGETLITKDIEIIGNIYENPELLGGNDCE